MFTSVEKFKDFCTTDEQTYAVALPDSGDGDSLVSAVEPNSIDSPYVDDVTLSALRNVGIQSEDLLQQIGYTRRRFERCAKRYDENDRRLLERFLIEPQRAFVAAAVARPPPSVETVVLSDNYAWQIHERVDFYVRRTYESLHPPFFERLCRVAVGESLNMISNGKEFTRRVIAHVVSLSPSSLASQFRKFVVTDLSYPTILSYFAWTLDSEKGNTFYNEYLLPVLSRYLALNEEQLDEYFGNLCERECVLSGLLITRRCTDLFDKGDRCDRNVFDRYYLTHFDFTRFREPVHTLLDEILRHYSESSNENGSNETPSRLQRNVARGSEPVTARDFWRSNGGGVDREDDDDFQDVFSARASIQRHSSRTSLNSNSGSGGGGNSFEVDCLTSRAVLVNRMFWLWGGTGVHTGHGHYVEEHNFKARLQQMNHVLKKDKVKIEELINLSRLRSICDTASCSSGSANTGSRFLNGGSSGGGGSVGGSGGAEDSGGDASSVRYSQSYIGYCETGRNSRDDCGTFMIGNLFVENFEVRTPATVQTVYFDYEKIGVDRADRFANAVGQSDRFDVLFYVQCAASRLDEFIERLLSDDAACMLLRAEILEDKSDETATNVVCESRVFGDGCYGGVPPSTSSIFVETSLDLDECAKMSRYLSDACVSRAAIGSFDFRVFRIFCGNVAKKCGKTNFRASLENGVLCNILLANSAFNRDNDDGRCGDVTVDSADGTGRADLYDWSRRKRMNEIRANIYATKRRRLAEHLQKRILTDAEVHRGAAPSGLDELLRDSTFAHDRLKELLRSRTDKKSERKSEMESRTENVSEECNKEAPSNIASNIASNTTHPTGSISCDWSLDVDDYLTDDDDEDGCIDANECSTTPNGRNDGANFPFSNGEIEMDAFHIEKFCCDLREDGGFWSKVSEHVEAFASSQRTSGTTNKLVLGLYIVLRRSGDRSKLRNVWTTTRDVEMQLLSKVWNDPKFVVCAKIDHLAESFERYVATMDGVACARIGEVSIRQAICQTLTSLYVFSACSTVTTLYLASILHAVKYVGQRDRTVYIFRGSSSSGKSCLVEKIREYYNSVTGVISEVALKSQQNETNTAVIPFGSNFCVQMDELRDTCARRLKSVLSEGSQNYRRYRRQEPKVMTMLASLFITVNDMFRVESDDGVVTRLRFVMPVYHRYYDLLTIREDSRRRMKLSSRNVSYQFLTRTFPKGFAWPRFLRGCFYIFERFCRYMTRGVNELYFLRADMFGRVVLNANGVSMMFHDASCGGETEITGRMYHSGGPVPLEPQPTDLRRARTEMLLKIDSFEKFLHTFLVRKSRREMSEADLEAWFAENHARFWIGDKTPSRSQLNALVDRFKIEFSSMRNEKTGGYRVDVTSRD